MQEQNTVYFDLLTIADSVFGHLHWSHEIVSQTIDFINRKENSFTVGCSTLIKVQLDTGRHHQDFGYSESIAKTEGSCIMRARRSSCTNALRRTLLAFEEARIKMMQDSASTSSFKVHESPEKRKRLLKQKEMQDMWMKRRALSIASNVTEDLVDNSTEKLIENPADDYPKDDSSRS